MNKIDNQFILSEAVEMMDELSNTSSSIVKEKIVSKHSRCKIIWMYVMNPYWTYGLTSKNAKKYPKKRYDKAIKCRDWMDLLDRLKSRSITGHAAIESVLSFVATLSKKEEEVFYSVLDKNLKAGCGAKTINKVFPDYIPEFNVALANVYDKKSSSKVEFNGTWYASRKMDGVRALAFVAEDGVQLRSRTGKLLKEMPHIEKEIMDIFQGQDVVLDGELCVVTSDGFDDFKQSVSEVKNAKSDGSTLKYYVFDKLSSSEFESGTSDAVYSKRYASLLKYVPVESTSRVTTLHQVILNSTDDLLSLDTYSRDHDWEGLIIRKDVVYNAKRSNDMLKLKIFETGEFQVLDMQRGFINTIKDGKHESLYTMTSVTILNKDVHVSVGSGFSLDEREYFFRNPVCILLYLLIVWFIFFLLQFIIAHDSRQDHMRKVF